MKAQSFSVIVCSTFQRLQLYAVKAKLSGFSTCIYLSYHNNLLFLLRFLLILFCRSMSLYYNLYLSFFFANEILNAIDFIVIQLRWDQFLNWIASYILVWIEYEKVSKDCLFDLEQFFFYYWHSKMLRLISLFFLHFFLFFWMVWIIWYD